MKIKGLFMIILVLLAVISVIWVLVTVYDATVNPEINPNVSQHLTPIQGEFNTEVLEYMSEKIGELPVAPQVFRELEKSRLIPPALRELNQGQSEDSE